ncbi:MAG TPA: hypothetical protein VH208_07645, partial [Myxococcaceae bacterium]|nr:hypothetical protein [Myxococcaceae bacterium]
MTRWSLSALGAVALMGCSSSGTQDGGNPDGGSSPDAGSSSGTVQGTHFIHYLTDTGAVLHPLDLSSEPPSASVWTDAGFITFSAQLVDAGFVIPGVPPGEYY